MKDFLIIGNGLAGIFCSHLLLLNKKKIHVIANQSQNSTQIAAGLYNPIVLKRFTLAWEAHEQIQSLINEYKILENILQQNIIFPKKLLRKLASVEEQNNWTITSDKFILKDYFVSDIFYNIFETINAPYGYGALNFTGYVDTKLLQSSYKNYLIGLNCFSNETFNYDQLLIKNKTFCYQNIEYKNIIFCEGYGLKYNPFFNYLPLDGTKGELITIKSEELKLDIIINSSIFILPLGNNLYRVGSTYNWNQKDNIPTLDAKNELLSQLNNLINCKYKVVEHQAGVRPTVNDRKPLLGEHPMVKNMYILNGLGTRGVMLAPYLSEKLIDFMIYNKPINPEIDIKRYQKLYKKD